MPARSEAQRRLFAIAEHHPEILYARNQRLADLPQKTLHDFAATKESAMPGKRTRRPKGIVGRRLSDFAVAARPGLRAAAPVENGADRNIP